MIKVPSLNDQEECVEVAGASIVIFRKNKLITIVYTIVPSQNFVQCIEDIHHDKSTKFERPGKVR